MLVLTRKTDQQIIIDDGRIQISVLSVVGRRVRLGIVAPSEVPVRRGPLAEPALCPEPVWTTAGRMTAES